MHSLSAASPITPSPTSSLRVSEELREAILSGEFGPGERLRTASLAKRFGSSRTPVREALVQLEGEGLVDIEPRRGAIVRSFASADLIDLYEIRALLEPAAAARAAQRIQRCGSSTDCARSSRSRTRAAGARARDRRPDRLERGVPRDRDRGRRQPAAVGRAARDGGHSARFRTAFWRDDAHRAFSQTCHRELVSALIAHSPERAEAVMRMHILHARDALVAENAG